MCLLRGGLAIRSLYLVHIYEKVGNSFVVVLFLLYRRMVIGHGDLAWKPTIWKVGLFTEINALLSETSWQTLLDKSLYSC